MAQPQPFHRQNHLLASLPPADLTSLETHLEPMELGIRHAIEIANKPIKHLYFPVSGIISVVASGPRNHKIEVGIIGKEGMSGISIVLGDDRTPNETYVQVAGFALRIAADDFRHVIHAAPSMRHHFFQYVQFFMIQTAHTALANGRAKVEERLARWLLMAHDRLDGDEIPLTHEFLALMLGVRRAGVTTTLHVLEARALISLERGRITMIDRSGLEALADGIYGVPEAEYRRLTGWRGKTQG
ncbi:MAG TPA: Crp/Fnr family transcriptional regulator [Micropepsaceae bacterium]|nr:Crp/Fnr family transcriptional regulator [Micropepsaceae bacterium]